MVTFREIKPVQKSESNTLGVVFVHGLQSSKTRGLRRSLKEWLRGIDLPNTRITSMGFDTTELLTQGDGKLISLSEALLKHLEQIQRSERYIFIAHGIAGWVVKESLSRFNSDDLASRAGIIFLGSLHNDPADWTTFTESFLTRSSKGSKHDGFLMEESQRMRHKSIRVLPRRRTESLAPPSSLDISFLQGVVDSNFKLMCQRHLPVLEYIDSQPQSNQADIRPASIKARRTDLSQSSFFGREQLVKLSLMDIQSKSEEDQRIRSLLKTRMSRENRFSTDTADADFERLSDRQITTNPTQTGYEGGTAAPALLSVTRRSSTERSGKLPVKSTFPHRRSLRPFETKYGLETIQLRDSNEKSEKEKQEPLRRGEHPIEIKVILASVYHKCGKFEAARKTYEEVLIMLPPSTMSPFSRDPQVNNTFRCRIAEIHLQEGHFKDAKEKFLDLEMESWKLVTENGNRAWVALEISRWLGITFDKLGDFRKAYQKLKAVEKEIEEAKRKCTSESKQSSELGKNSMLTKNALALVFAHMGDFARAITTSDDAIEIARQNGDLTDFSKHNTVMDLNRATIFAYSGDYKTATKINQEVSKELERQFGSKNFATLESWSLQTQLLAANSMPDEAQDRAEETLKGMRNELGKQHPLTLELLGTLVLIQLSQGLITDAMGTAQYVFKSNKSSHALGPDHPQTISSMNILAKVESAAGQLQEAELLQMEVVKLAEDRLGEHHPSTVSYKLNLASIYGHMGNWAKSQEIARSIFWMQGKQFLGSSSEEQNGQVFLHNAQSWRILKQFQIGGDSSVKVRPSFISTMHCLGVAERELDVGDLSLARELLSEAVKWRTERLGASHVDTLWSQFELAKVERECGGIEQLGKAFRSFEIVLTERRELLGESHPDTISARHELSITVFQMGHEDEAAQEQEKVFRIRTKVLGTHHPDTIRSQLDLARVYRSLGYMEDAESRQLAAIGEQIRQSRLTGLGLSVADEDNKRRLYALILDRFNVDQHTNSDTIPTQTREEPQYYPEIINTLADLAFTYFELGDEKKRESAAHLQEIVVSLQEQYLGNNALKTLVSVNNLGLIYQDLSRTQDAITLFERVLDNTEPHSPLHQNSRSNLASLYFEKRDFERAETIQKTVVDSQRESISNGPKALMESMFNLALIRKERAKEEGTSFTASGALELMQEVVQLSERLGHDHPLHLQMYDTLEEWILANKGGEHLISD